MDKTNIPQKPKLEAKDLKTCKGCGIEYYCSAKHEVDPDQCPLCTGRISKWKWKVNHV